MGRYKHQHIYDVITLAIQALSQYPEQADLVQKLTYERDSFKPPKWTKETIEKAFDDYVAKTGKYPTTEDLKHSPDLPTHPSIELCYNMTAAEWLNQRYPNRLPTAEEKRNIYTTIFVSEYNRLKPCGPKDFETRRDKENSRSWFQTAKYHGLQSWNKFIKYLGLPIYDKQGREINQNTNGIKVTVYTDIHE